MAKTHVFARIGARLAISTGLRARSRGWLLATGAVLLGAGLFLATQLATGVGMVEAFAVP